MKTYNSPMLQVVGINKNDIVTASDPNVALSNTQYTGSSDGSGFSAPGQRGVFDWDAGY